MLRGLWDKLVGRRKAAELQHEAELEHMSEEERHRLAEGVKDLQGEEFVEEHLGGIDAERLLPDGHVSEEEPPRV